MRVTASPPMISSNARWDEGLEVSFEGQPSSVFGLSLSPPRGTLPSRVLEGVMSSELTESVEVSATRPSLHQGKMGKVLTGNRIYPRGWQEEPAMRR